MDYRSAVKKLGEQNQVFEFFWTFSVFECALKRRAFCLTKHGYLEADWKKYAKTLAPLRRRPTDQFISKKLSQAMDELRLLAPRKQKWSEGAIVWESIRTKNKEGYAIDCLTTVRNNLFHGGKYPDGPEPEVARDAKLISAALNLLNAIYEADHDLKKVIDAQLVEAA